MTIGLKPSFGACVHTPALKGEVSIGLQGLNAEINYPGIYAGG